MAKIESDVRAKAAAAYHAMGIIIATIDFAPDQDVEVDLALIRAKAQEAMKEIEEIVGK